MTIDEIIQIIEPLGSARTKKRYISQGAVEPLFGMTIKALKPIAKELMEQENCQQLAYDLFDTGNYDLMYLAGMIVDPHTMSESKFDEWLEKSYFYMIGDYTVAICLSETDVSKSIANRWINSGDDLKMSAGYSTYCWLLGSRDDDFFDQEQILSMLQYVEANIQSAPNRTRYAMYYLVYCIGVSYQPLHQEAVDVANIIGEITVLDHNGKEQTYNAKEAIEKQVERGKIGFKRRNVRC